MKSVHSLLRDVQIPLFYKVKLAIQDNRVQNIQSVLQNALKRPNTLDRIKTGSSVAITAGSREIKNFEIIMRTLIDALKQRKATPFIIPAMGSHGGATDEGQRDVIAQFNITEECMGVPIISSLETVVIGETDDGIPVHVDKQALKADYIIPVGRIKPHTDFKGRYESGLMKMMAVGIGKQHGASICHSLGMNNMSRNICSIGKYMIEKCSIPFGIGIIENAFHDTWRIVAIPAELIENEEPALLEEAKTLLPVIPFDKVDIIVCEEMGKDISGTGMDSNIIGRSASLGVSHPFAERIGVFSLTKKSHGNANGMGLADAITQRFFEEIEFDQTYPNAITSMETTAVKIPSVMDTDELCVKFLIKTCTGCGSKGIRVVWIKNTLSLNEFFISEGLYRNCKLDLKSEDIEYRVLFNKNGDFICFSKVDRQKDSCNAHKNS